MKKTPWAEGSLPSDRIKRSTPRRTQTSQTASSHNSKGKSRDPPKSKEVIRLEVLVDGLRVSSEKRLADPSGGCFCQARMHKLSPYTPICLSCGLIICDLHQPFWICPHGPCSSVLLSPAARDTLLARLDAQISETVIKEAQARLQAIEDARAAEGAFPALASTMGAGAAGGASVGEAGASDPLRSHPANQTRKVLSLTGSKRGGKVIVTSYTPSASSLSSVARKRGEEAGAAPDVKRVRAPSTEVEHVGRGVKVAVYTPPTRQDEQGGSDMKKKKESGLRA